MSLSHWRQRPPGSHHRAPGGSARIWGPGKWAWAASFVALGTAALALAVLDPPTAMALLTKEGPVEHASHAILALAALAWALVCVRTRGRPRSLAVGMTLFSCFLLLEEVDWGAVYGYSFLARPLGQALGRPNVHNSLGGMAYPLLVLPLVAYFLAPAWLTSRVRADAGERRGFLALALLMVASNVSETERFSQELLELLLYALITGTALRLARPQPVDPP